jgi:hypothetical protein
MKLTEAFMKEAKVLEYYNEYNLKNLYKHYIPNVDGVFLLLINKETVVGIVGGIVQQHMFNPEKVVLTELLWYVNKENRKSRKSLELIKRFEKEGKNLGASEIFLTLKSFLKDKAVQTFYEKIGYVEQERTFSKEI